VRKTFFDIINNSEINVKTEIERVDHYFSSTGYYKESLKSFINRTCFRDWKHNKRCLSIEDLMNSYKIQPSNTNPSVEEMFAYFEFMINLIFFMDKKMPSLRINWMPDVINYVEKSSLEIVRNIISILDELNYKFKENEKGEYMIVEKSEIVSAVSEIYEDIAPKVIEYQRFNLKGNLERKKELLLALAHKYEAINDKLIKNNYKDLATNVRCLINRLDIRHNPKAGSKEEAYLKKLSKEEHENWYDKTYDTILLALMGAHYIDYKSEIDELKSELGS